MAALLSRGREELGMMVLMADDGAATGFAGGGAGFVVVVGFGFGGGGKGNGGCGSGSGGDVRRSGLGRGVRVVGPVRVSPVAVVGYAASTVVVATIGG